MAYLVDTDVLIDVLTRTPGARQLLPVYPKSRQEDLTQEQVKILSRLVKEEFK